VQAERCGLDAQIVSDGVLDDRRHPPPSRDKSGWSGLSFGVRRAVDLGERFCACFDTLSVVDAPIGGLLSLSS
jgi:hypothetical protein